MIVQDDFQSYAVGTQTPFGGFTGVGGFTKPIIDNSIPSILGKSKYVLIPSLTALRYQTLSYNGAISIFVGVNFIDWDTRFILLQSDGVELGSVYKNYDGTISIRLGGTTIATSTRSLFLNRWFWLQINFVWSNVAGNVFITAEIAADEEIICTGTYATSISVAGLGGLGVNDFQFGDRYNLAELTIDTLQSIGSDPNPGSPSARVTQSLSEIVYVPDSASLRITQGLVEVNELPDSANLRITQGLIELYILQQTAQGWQIYEA